MVRRRTVRVSRRAVTTRPEVGQCRPDAADHIEMVDHDRQPATARRRRIQRIPEIDAAPHHANTTEPHPRRSPSCRLRVVTTKCQFGGLPAGPGREFRGLVLDVRATRRHEGASSAASSARRGRRSSPAARWRPFWDPPASGKPVASMSLVGAVLRRRGCAASGPWSRSPRPGSTRTRRRRSGSPRGGTAG